MGFWDMMTGGRLATKESRATRALVAMDAGQPQWTPERYDALAKAGVLENIWVKRCIAVIATAAAGVKWGAYTTDSDGKRVEFEPTTVALRSDGIGHLLRMLHVAANDRGESWANIVESSFSYWHVGGNYFIEAVGSGADTPTDPVLWVYTHVPDDTMKVIPDVETFIGGYLLEPPGGQPIRFEPHQMLHGKFWHPTNQYFGLSPVFAASHAVSAHNSARAWNVAMLQNNARPAGILSAPDLDDSQLDDLEKRLDKKWGNDGKRKTRIRRPLVLSGGLSWTSLSLTPAEMDWLEGMRGAQREIAAVFGVPAELLGDTQSKTYASYPEARKAFYEETMLPLLDRFRDDLNAWLAPRYGDNVLIDYKRDEIEALQENRDAVWKRTTDAFRENILTRDEARADLGKPAVDDGALVFASDLQRSRLPSETLSPAIGKAAPTDVIEAQIIRPALYLPRVTGKALDLSTDEAKAAYHAETIDERVKAETIVEAAIVTTFDDERARVIKAIETSPGIDSVLGVAAAAVTVDEWARVYAVAWKGVLDRFGRRELAGLKGAWRDAFERKDVDPDAALDVFTAASEAFAEMVVPARIAGVTDTTRGMVTDAITTGIREGQTIPEIAKAVDDAFGSSIGSRATMIARTEVIGASGAGGQIMAEASGLNLVKEWLTAMDSRTRTVARGDEFDHSKMHGVRVPLSQSFDVPGRSGSDSLMFPGDPRGKAENIIQCRCAAAHIPID